MVEPKSPKMNLVIRNDNAGDNSFDNIEIFSDADADLWFHYYEDRSEHIEAGGRLGNITDSRGWVRDLPKGTLPQDEINAIFTMIGEAQVRLISQEIYRIDFL